MTIVTADLEQWTWSPEVLSFAQEHRVAEYLDPMMQATRELFPAAREIRVSEYLDPELADTRWISWEIDVPKADLGSSRDLRKQWTRAFMKICPSTLSHFFSQTIIPVL
jgi:hypothetical protein